MLFKRERNRSSNQVSFLLLFVIFFCVPCWAQTLTPQNPSADSESPPKPKDGAVAKTMLQGSVEHAESLPSLDESLKPGSKFNEDMLLKLGTSANNDWFWIPSWYAGKRHTDEALIVYRYDFRTGTASTPMQRQLERQDSISGYQSDRNGEIWDFKNIPFIQHVDSGLVRAVLYIKNMAPLVVSRSQIVLKYEEVSITYSPRSRKIIEVVQQEQINTISPLAAGTLRTDISVKSFGWDGQPQRAEQSVVLSNIVEPYHPINTLKERDLRPMFRDFLIAHKLENLVPLDLAN